MENTFKQYKETTYENVGSKMMLKIDDVFSDIIYISIYNQLQTPDKLTLSLKSKTLETNKVTLIPSMCSNTVAIGLCTIEITYDILEKTFFVPGISGVFIMKNVPSRPNEKSPVTLIQSGYTPFPTSSPQPNSSSNVQAQSSIKSVTQFSNFITVTFTVSKSTDWKLDLVDKKSGRVLNSFKNTVQINPESREENRRTFQNVQDGVYVVKLIPYSKNNNPGVESTSNQIVMGITNVALSPAMSSSISGYTPFPSAQSPMKPAQSPMKPAQSPMTPAQSPMTPAQSPMTPAQSPTMMSRLLQPQSQSPMSMTSLI
jgi:hypothetical protein